MLMPKRVKFRKAHRGRRAGKATRGHLVNFGDYGLKALGTGLDYQPSDRSLPCCFITSYEKRWKNVD